MTPFKALLFLTLAVVNLAAQDDPSSSLDQGCTFRSNPDDFLQAQSRARQDIFERVRKIPALRANASSVPAQELPRRNFIDNAIFDRLAAAAVGSAPLSTDEEFVRRIHLDLTGRIPGPDDVRRFVSDKNPDKRTALIDKLLASPEFTDKWAVWFGDLLQNTERLASSARAPQIEGRNSFAGYLRDAVANNKPIKQIAFETITARGNNYFTENGPANYPVLASTAMGPAQDTYDMMLVRSVTAYLGLGNYDCLLCHSGRGHLEAVNLWGSKGTRIDAQRMAAHFSRMRLNNGAPAGTPQYEHPLYNSTDVQDAATGQYDLNTNFGNRPNRVAVGTTRNVTPEYRDGSTPKSGNWRAEFAQKLVADPMFGRNFANRLWKQFFGMGLVDPVDTLDPDRLDPKNPPPAPWTLQATHPELLEELAAYFQDNNTDLRAFIRLLVESTAYQLSSSYPGEWKLEYVPLFARHYPRRLDAEEIHDAITQATSMPGRYTYALINGQTVQPGTPITQSQPVVWAMQLPDPSEPRNNGAVRDFMRSFNRGNRDTAPRSQAGAIVQQLSLMNDRFVLDRIRMTASPTLQMIARMPKNEDALEQMFLTFLSRQPSELERTRALAYLSRTKTTAERNAALEDLAWVCINKADFLFSY